MIKNIKNKFRNGRINKTEYYESNYEKIDGNDDVDNQYTKEDYLEYLNDINDVKIIINHNLYKDDEISISSYILKSYHYNKLPIITYENSNYILIFNQTKYLNDIIKNEIIYKSDLNTEIDMTITYDKSNYHMLFKENYFITNRIEYNFDLFIGETNNSIIDILNILGYNNITNLNVILYYYYSDGTICYDRLSYIITFNDENNELKLLNLIYDSDNENYFYLNEKEQRWIKL